MKSGIQFSATVWIGVWLAIGPSIALACTGITIKPKDGSIIFARTLEFALDLKEILLKVVFR